MVLRFCALLMAAAVAVAAPTRAQVASSAEPRLALVIGNGAYKGQPLRNPANDARIVAASLRRLGFTVVELIDAGRRAMDEAVLDFGERLKAGGVGAFYYAGHGVQVRGHNYLLPVDAAVTTEASVRVQALDVGLVLDLMSDARNRANIVILDSCRNNPFIVSRGAKGLAAIDAARGTLIAYSTAPGAVAVDGDGEHSPYTAALVKALDEPGLKVEEVFKRVRSQVVETTRGAQTPWESSSLTGDLVINLNITVNPPALALSGRDPADVAFWTSIQSSGDPRDYDDYLKQFPGGTFSSLAKRRFDELQRKQLAAAEEERRRAVAAEAEKQRFAALEAERRRKAAEDAERKRLAALEAERQRKEAEEERKRKQAEDAERQRIAAAEAEHQRRTAEAEQRRRSALEAERQRMETEEAERQRASAALAERERAAAEEAERRREAEAEEAARRQQQASLPPPAATHGSVRGREWSSCEMRTPPFVASSPADGMAGLWFGQWMTSVGGDSRTRWETLRCRFLLIRKNAAQIDIFSAGTPPFSSQDSVTATMSSNEISFMLHGRGAKCVHHRDRDEFDCAYGGRAGTSHTTKLRRVVSADYLPEPGKAANAQ